mmetsp:Transcript_10623/g.27292  ORF Transcript_10623/g.27292 Transcript_10623/m.27292 type:complete len:211 (+) Transcript_10623:1274-1906(+)
MFTSASNASTTNSSSSPNAPSCRSSFQTDADLSAGPRSALLSNSSPNGPGTHCSCSTSSSSPSSSGSGWSAARGSVLPGCCNADPAGTELSRSACPVRPADGVRSRPDSGESSSASPSPAANSASGSVCAALLPDGEWPLRTRTGLTSARPPSKGKMLSEAATGKGFLPATKGECRLVVQLLSAACFDGQSPVEQGGTCGDSVLLKYGAR